MKRKMKAILYSKRGNISVLMAGIIILLFAVCGIVIDLGLAIEGKVKLQIASHAAAVAIREAVDLETWEEERISIIDLDIAEEYARMYLNLNLPEAKLVSIEEASSQEDTIVIRTSLEVDYIFMKIFGVESNEFHMCYWFWMGEND